MFEGNNVTGEPQWELAWPIVEQLRNMPAATAEGECDTRLWNILSFLFPGVKYPEIASKYQSGDGEIDVYCRNVVFEAKNQGKNQNARRKPDGTHETPQEQAVRYLNALTLQTSLFDNCEVGWRACVTDGKEWNFYDYNREQKSLTLLKELYLSAREDDEILLAYLYDFVNRTVKVAQTGAAAICLDAIGRAIENRDVTIHQSNREELLCLTLYDAIPATTASRTWKT